MQDILALLVPWLHIFTTRTQSCFLYAAMCCRYFAETSATLFTTILGQRDSRAPDGSPFRDYWLSDGTYGSFRIQVPFLCYEDRSQRVLQCLWHIDGGLVHQARGLCLAMVYDHRSAASSHLYQCMCCLQVAVDGLEPNYSVLRSPLLPPPTVEENAQLLACRLWGNSDRDGDVVHKVGTIRVLIIKLS